MKSKMSEQGLAQIEAIRSQLESKIKAKIREIINETESRGLSRRRTYDVRIPYQGRPTDIRLKDTEDMIYLRTSRVNANAWADSRDEYLISQYNKSPAKALLEAVKVLKAVVQHLETSKLKEAEEMVDAKKEIEDL